MHDEQEYQKRPNRSIKRQLVCLTQSNISIQQKRR
ncbi:MAG: hypothetical protein ACOVSW_00545, partial [Candidatus Kapaibacteriota bacterium]